MKRGQMWVVFMLMIAIVAGNATGEMQKRMHEGENKGPARQMRHGEMGGGGDMGGREAMMTRMLDNPEIAEQIGLSDEQRKSLKDSMFAFRKKEAELKYAVEVAGLEQVQLMTADKIDEQAVMKSIEKKYEAITEMAKLRAKKALLLKNTLTEKQVEKIHELMRKRGEMRRHKRAGGDTESPGEEMPPQEME